ncbi:MAG: class I SAM-dependent methyltransferase [Desulfomonilaceae bacterium]|nr:class I SAM-dependent methyltransferase [Desulfomonilaceae bacterium]
MTMKTDYYLHDRHYQKLKESGKNGNDLFGCLDEHKKELEFAFSSPLFKPGSRILELGCGTGDISLWLASQGHDVIGVDISTAAIHWAKEKAGETGMRVKFVVSDVCHMKELDDDSFDVVIDSHCFHCIIGEDRSRFLKGARRVLVRGGLLYIATMCGDPNVALTPGRHFDPSTRVCFLDDVAFRFYGKSDDILQEIRDADFRILEWRVEESFSEDEQDTLLVNAVKP